MPLGWLAKNYERTCRECGYSWQVPRSIARRGIRGISAFSVFGASKEVGFMQPGGPGLSDVEADIADRAELMEGYRRCAKCGADDFTQRPIRADRG
jgi:predicted nucleic-acid-binding Zn-ribbon protein